MVNLFIFEKVLREKELFFKTIFDKEGLRQAIRDSIISIVIFGSLYGATMGVWSGSFVQILFSAMKLPLLLLISIAVVLPSYYVINLVIGGRESFMQLATLIFTGFSIVSTILLAFVPINLFFIITSPRDTISYLFMVFMTLAIFGFGCILTIIYLVECVQYLTTKNKGFITLRDMTPITATLVILAFVGTQLAWFIRPWYNTAPGFVRSEVSGNFYTNILSLIFKYPSIGLPFLLLMGILIFFVGGWVKRMYERLVLPPEVRTQSSSHPVDQAASSAD